MLKMSKKQIGNLIGNCVYILLALLFILLVIASAGRAEEAIKTTVTFRNDIVNPDQGGSFVKQWTSLHLQDGRFGGGIDMFTTPEKDFLALKPYLTAKMASRASVITGLLTNSVGQDYAHLGVLFYPSFGGLSFYLDARQYDAMSDKAKDFADVYLGISHPVTADLTIGLDLVYDRYWEKKDDYYMAGLPLSYRLTEKLKFFVRPTADSFVPQNGAKSRSQSVRTGFQYNF